MSKIVEVPGHGPVEFPDGMSDADIVAAIKKNLLMAPKENATSRAIVEPNELQRRMGISKNRYKDENLAGNIGRGFLSLGDDVGRETRLLAHGLGASPDVANVAAFAGDMSTALIPMVPSGKAAATVAAPALDTAGKFLMRSSLKPSLAEARKGRAGPAVETMLNEGANVTAGGVEKIKDKIAVLAEQVDQAIAPSGARVSTREVADYVPNALDKFKDGPLAASAVDDLGNVQKTFIEHSNVEGAADISVQTAHKMKSGYQRAIGDKGFGELKAPTTEGEKQIARALREKVAEAVPAVKEPLAHESELIRALKMAERQVAVDERKNPIGIGWLAQPHMIPWWLWDRSPLAKSVMARALYSGQEQIPGAVGGLTGGLLYEGNRPKGLLSP